MNKWMSKTSAVIILTGMMAQTVAPSVSAAATPVKAGVGMSQTKVQLKVADVKKFAEQFFSEERLKAWGVPGATFSVVQDDSVVYQQGFGLADVAANTTVHAEETIFRTGSVSKVVTATALMQLVEQGKVSLDAGVNDYLPEPWIEYLEGNPVTVAHLLTHTTGFDGGMDLRPGDIYYNLDEYYDLETYAKETIPHTVRKPGEAFKYDNFASMLQGYIVEQVSKQSFEQYVQEHIFAPLGMKSSGFRTTPEAAADMATGYMPGLQPFPQYGVKPSDLPQGGWYTTAEDAAIFMLAHLNGGTYGQGTILTPESTALMQQYQVFIQPDVPVMAYGFEASMFPQYDRGQTVIAKGGDILGFSSFMWLLPEHNIGSFVSVNTNNASLREELYRDFMQQFLPDVSKTKAPLDTRVEELQPFEGSYMDLRLESWKSNMKATGNGMLTMEDTLLGTIEFTQVGPMTFVDAAGTELVFKLDESGEPQYFKYKNVGYSKKIEAMAYADVPEDSLYAPAINNLRTYNIFREDQEMFRPEEAITRAEFVAYFMRLLKLPPSSNPSLFNDLKGHQLENEIQAAAELGLVKGTPDGHFMPEQAMARQEAAAVVYRLMQLQGVGAAPRVPLKELPSDWAVDAVSIMIMAGFYGPEVAMEDDGSWNYRPHAELLRKEAAAMLNQLVQIPQQAN